MKVILIGYPGSQKIVPASKYLTSKYLPEFDIIYLNYKGHINGWSEYLQDYLRALEDEHIIFALDDYLVASHLSLKTVNSFLKEMNESIVCVKLCNASPEELKEYPVTTQYCIWDRKYLIWLLSKVSTPWEFEIIGSQIFNTLNNKIVLHRPHLSYFTNSSISARWEGVRLDGLSEEDKNYIITNGLIS